MHRGNVVAAVLSLLGSAMAFAVVIAWREPASMYTALGVVLLANAGVRLRLAVTRDSGEPER